MKTKLRNSQNQLNYFCVAAILMVVIAAFVVILNYGRDIPGLFTKDQWIQIVTASITLLAVLVALFQEKIRDWFRMADLDAAINLVPPDSHKIEITVGTRPYGGRVTDDCIFVRLRIAHLGGAAAEKVEVMLVSCMELEDGRRKPKKNFLPLSLTWSHFQPPTTVMRIPSGLFRHCDLGYLIKDRDKTKFVFDTAIQPNIVGDEKEPPNELKPGKYEIGIWISGDNFPTIKKRWTIELDGKWSPKEGEVLNKHLRIEPTL